MSEHANLLWWPQFSVEAGHDITILCYFHWLWAGVDV
jgi:hypothetical protein